MSAALQTIINSLKKGEPLARAGVDLRREPTEADVQQEASRRIQVLTAAELPGTELARLRDEVHRVAEVAIWFLRSQSHER